MWPREWCSLAYLRRLISVIVPRYIFLIHSCCFKCLQIQRSLIKHRYYFLCWSALFKNAPTYVRWKVKKYFLLMLHCQSLGLKGIAQRHLVGRLWPRSAIAYSLPTQRFFSANLGIWTRWPQGFMLAFSSAVNCVSCCSSQVIVRGVRHAL